MSADEQGLRSRRDESGVQSIARAAQLLSFTASQSPKGARISDLVRLSELPAPTVHRLLKALETERLIHQDKRTRRYFIGTLVHEIGLAARNSTPSLEPCLPHLTSLSEKTGRPIHLVAESGLDAVCIERIITDRSFPISGGIGVRRPLGLGAGGAMLLATKGQDEADSIIDANADRYGRFKSSSADKVRETVERARERGYAVSRCDPGILAVAVTARHDTGLISLAMKIPLVWSGDQTHNLDRIAARLRHAATEMTRLLAAPHAHTA